MYWKTADKPDAEQLLAWEAVEALCQLPHVGTRIIVGQERHAHTEDRRAHLGAAPLENLAPPRSP
jgi:hypothetical protein